MTIDKKMERAGILILYVFILLLSYLSPSALVFAEAVSAKADLRLEVDLQELKEKLPSELNSESGEIILLEFILEEEGQELQRKTMALDHETAPKGKITFENLELSSAQVKIETYEATQFTRQDEKLSYVLRLKKAGDGMVLEGPEGVQISVLNTETPSKEASVAEKEVTDPNSQAAEDAQAKLHSEREKETPKLEKGDKIPEKGEEISKEGEKAPKKEEEKASEKGEKTTETPKGKVEKNPSTVEEKTQVEEKTPLEESNPKEEKRPLEGALGLLNRAKELLFKSEEEAVEAPPSLEIGDFAPVSAVGKGNSSETITVPLGETEKDGEKYYLSFDLSRPEFSVYENIHAVYSNHFSSNQKYSEFFDFENWGLKDFQVEHKLHIDLNGERRSISKYMTYTAESCSWDGVASFDFSDKIEVNSNSLNVVYYYQTIDGKPYYFHPYLLTYDLYLTEENGELTLKIPRLYGSRDAFKRPTGTEEIISLKNPILKKVDRELYLNGQTGSDDNTGEDPKSPVKTFEKAKQLAMENPKVEHIIVTGTVPVEGEISLDGTNAKLIRAADFNGYLLKVGKGKTASLSNIIIDGNAPKNSKIREVAPVDEGTAPNGNIEKSLLEVNGGKLIIQDGTLLQNNKIKKIRNTAARGGAIYATGATVNMTGGIIEENQATYGGGICLNSSTMDFSGGIVQNNESKLFYDGTQYYSAGGGILAKEGSKLNMSGDAQVLNNHAAEIGGGISIGSNQWGKGSSLQMTGGTIDGNTSGATGGGIFVQAEYFDAGTNVATISAGAITNNTMSGAGVTSDAFGGGGIYVNGATDMPDYGIKGTGNGLLKLTNVVITDNTAVYDGAGYAACPISNTTIEVNEGGALYNNEAKRKAEEVYILCSTNYGLHSGQPEYELSERMLGGVPYQWENEDESELEELAGKLTKSGEELSVHTDRSGNELTQELSKVIIRGNHSATRGGGIGSNGDVIIGEEGPTTSVSVEKKWEDNDNANQKRPESITVKLIATVVGKDFFVEEYVLSDENEWKHTFEKLPTTGGGQDISYRVEEVAVEGYTATVAGNAKDGFVITNRVETPPTPEEPETEVSVEKRWVDGSGAHRPKSIEVKLLAKVNGLEKVVEKVSLSGASGWKHTFTHLPTQKNGQTIIYRVEEVAVKGYTATIAGNAKDGFVITNKVDDIPPPPPTPEEPETEVSVEKRWVDGSGAHRPKSIEVKLLAKVNGLEKVVEKVSLSGASGWKHVFTHLPTQKNGQTISYRVEEVAVKGYTATIAGSAKDGFVITNKVDDIPPPPPTPEEPETEVSVEKRWVDGNGAHRPKSIEVKLLAKVNGLEKVVEKVSLSGASGWKHSFTHLPTQENGKDISYRVEEVKVPGYTATTTGNAQNGFVITNKVDDIPPPPPTPEEPETEVSVEKRWVDGNGAHRPKSIEVKLLAKVNGLEKVVEKVSLSGASGWKHTFTHLPTQKNGKDISYRVEEVKVPGYTATTTGNAQNGFVITNKVETPPTTTPPTTTPPDTSPPDLPKTGDGINPSHLAMGGLSLGVGLIALGLWRRRYAH